MMKRFRVLTLAAVVVLGLASCSKEVEDKGPAPDPNPYTDLIIKFTHDVDGSDLVLDTAQYENQLSNLFGVNSLKYLVGILRLNSWTSQDLIYTDEDDYHLVDINDESTLLWDVKDSILVDDYKEITIFLGFGHDENMNKTGSHSDLSNAGFAWPPQIGGGYYTLRMSGNYYSTTSSSPQKSYDLAIGSKTRKETTTDTTYIMNPIYCSMTDGFSIPKGTKKVVIEVSFNVNKLFRSVNDVGNYNLDTYTSGLEYNAIGSSILSKNILQCFRMVSITVDDNVVEI